MPELFRRQYLLQKTTYHALIACRAHNKNNARTIYKAADVLLNIPDPITDVWRLCPRPLQDIQPWLDATWPGQLTISTQGIRPPKRPTPRPDTFAQNTFLNNDGSLNIDLL